MARARILAAGGGGRCGAAMALTAVGGGVCAEVGVCERRRAAREGARHTLHSRIAEGRVGRQVGLRDALRDDALAKLSRRRLACQTITGYTARAECVVEGAGFSRVGVLSRGGSLMGCHW